MNLHFVLATRCLNRSYSYSQYWTGTSLQLRLMRGVFLNANDINLFLMIFPCMSRHYRALGSRVGAAMRALASHQCVPGSIPGSNVMWVEFVVGSRPCSEGFSLGSPVFLHPQKPTFLNSNVIGKSRATGLSVEDCCCHPR